MIGAWEEKRGNDVRGDEDREVDRRRREAKWKPRGGEKMRGVWGEEGARWERI